MLLLFVGVERPCLGARGGVGGGGVVKVQPSVGSASGDRVSLPTVMAALLVRYTVRAAP